MLAQLRAAVAAGGLDAVFLALHGAAAAEHVDDPEGAMLRRVREVVGADMPVVVSLDHHANITQVPPPRLAVAVALSYTLNIDLETALRRSLPFILRASWG